MRSWPVVRRIVGVIDHDAITWGIAPRTAWLILITPVAVVLALAALLAVPPVFLAVTQEDGYLEWGQVLVLALIAGSAAALSRSLARQDRRGLATLYVVVTVGTLFVLFEEVSWGQRIIGLVTPDFLAEINRQGETNIHNIRVIQWLFGFGELVVAVYAIGAGLVAASVRPDLARFYPLVPPAFLATAFLLPGAYRLVRYTVAQEPGRTLNRLAEVAELSLYLGILVFVVLVLIRVRREASESAARA